MAQGGGSSVESGFPSAASTAVRHAQQQRSKASGYFIIGSRTVLSGAYARDPAISITHFSRLQLVGVLTNLQLAQLIKCLVEFAVQVLVAGVIGVIISAGLL